MFNIILPKINLIFERWKWNKDYRVYVSNLGHFKDEHKRLLPLKVSSSGYCHVETYTGLRLAHRLVMLTWCPIPDAENLTVDHLDHNKRNNALFNLEWVTKKENEHRAKRDYVYPEYEQEIREIKAQLEIIKNENKKFSVYYSKNKKYITTFNSLNEARKWFMEKQGVKEDPRSNITITKHIKKAVENNSFYVQYLWKKGEM